MLSCDIPDVDESLTVSRDQILVVECEAHGCHLLAVLESALVLFGRSGDTLGGACDLRCFKGIGIHVLIVASKVDLALYDINCELVDGRCGLNHFEGEFREDVVDTEGLVMGSTKGTTGH